MKCLACLFITLLFTHNVLATNLCATSCDLIITFPDGGSIEAVEALVITFGTGGELNLGAAGTINANPQPTDTDFSAGGDLLLAKGESVTFGPGGSLILGAGGNIDYLNMIINSSGGARLVAEGIIDTIVIKTLRITGRLEITFEAGVVTFLTGGTLQLDSGSTLIIIAETGSLSPSVCSIQDPSFNNVISTGVTTFGSSDTCAGIINSLGVSSDILTVGTIDPNATLTTTATITLTPGGTGTTGGLTLEPQILTQEFLSSLPDGTELLTDDGNTCILTSGSCMTIAGVKYYVVDGKLIPAPAASDGSGQLNTIDLYALFLFLISFRYAGFLTRENRFFIKT